MADNPQAFRVLDNSLAASPVDVGAIVYRCKGWDYGCANDDTRMTGIEHTSVTLAPSGDYPFFTIPKRDLEPIAAAAMLNERQSHEG